MPPALAGLAREYQRLLALLPARLPVSYFQSALQSHPTHNGDAHVEIVDGELNYVVTERGAELHRRVASGDDDLLYWLFDDVTASMAWSLSPSPLHRVLRRDPRPHRFETHVDLLARLNPAWAERKKQHYADVLDRYPYRRKT